MLTNMICKVPSSVMKVLVVILTFGSIYLGILIAIDVKLLIIGSLIGATGPTLAAVILMVRHNNGIID